MLSTAAKLLDRLQGVKEAGPGRWLARCPAHEDRTPSLSVREVDDGRLLIHDFGGCGTDDVLAAVGLTLSDLFPRRLPQHSYPRSQPCITARDLLEIVSEEASVVAIIAADMLAGKVITEFDFNRLAQAAARIGRARDHAYG